MRKLILLLSLMVITVVGVKAQVYVGGAINIGFNSSEDSTEKRNYSSFGISPRIGYQLDRRTSVGVDMGVGFIQNNNKTDNIKINANAYHFAPYLRYDFIRFDTFAIAGDTSIGFGWSKQKTENNSVSMNSLYQNNIYLRFVPMLTLDVSRRITLEARLDFMSFNFSRMHSWMGSETADKTDFNFGFDTGNIFTTGKLTFGLIYRF